MILPWECEASISISSEMSYAMERLHEDGKLEGGVRVEPTTDEATYRYLVTVGRAEVKVTGFMRGEVFIRWDAAIRLSKDAGHPHPPRLTG